MSGSQQRESVPPRRLIAGRARETEELSRALAEAAGGGGQLWLLSGEPGIGKTTLAQAVARLARERGFTVSWGRAWQAGGAPAFWPWREALDGLLLQHPAQDLLLDAETHALAPVLPERFGGTAPSAATPEAARFQLFLAVRTLLARAAGSQPIVLVFDDLHAADRASLLLLQFVAQALESAPILVLGTYREVEARLDAEVGRLIASVVREGSSLSLGRLDVEAAAALVAARAPELGGRLLERLLALAQGNPLFLDRMMRAFVADPTAFASEAGELPAGVSELVRDALGRLPELLHQLLEAGAVVGDEFDLDLVAEVCQAGENELDELVRRAGSTGILLSAGLGRQRFGHALYREVVYRDLPRARRASLHASVLQALERRHAADAKPPFVQLAHHALGAGPAAIAQAVRHAIRGAEDCFLQLAYDDGLSLLDRAQAELERLPEELTLRGEIQLARGQLRMSLGDLDLGQSLCRHAAELATQIGDADLLARAALGYGSTIRVALMDPVMIELLARALAALDERHPKLRVRVMARLAAARHPAASHEAIALARDAVKQARQLGEDRTLLEVLFTALSVFMDFVDPRERIPLNREVAALGLRLGDRPKRLRSFARLFHDHVELGEFETAREYIEAYERLATELQLEHVLWRPAAFRALIGLVQGDFALVERERQRAERLAGADREAARTLTAQRHGLLFARQELATLRAGIEADAHRLFEE
ncbi:MAG TPA: BREX system ATP-binding domain-containing protein, partial [Polyangiaceae bacterium]|nr:BREX system ATP-binding domain-containing protein [Polyangiaceae bacterium]